MNEFQQMLIDVNEELVKEYEQKAHDIDIQINRIYNENLIYGDMSEREVNDRVFELEIQLDKIEQKLEKFYNNRLGA